MTISATSASTSWTSSTSAPCSTCMDRPKDRSRPPLAVLAELRERALVRHIGLSNVTPAQIAEGQRICEIVCVQNHYNLAHRTDDSPDRRSCRRGRRLCAVFSTRRIHPFAIVHIVRCRGPPRRDAHAGGARLVASSRAQHPFQFPGASSVRHLQENLAAAECPLPDDAVEELDLVAGDRKLFDALKKAIGVARFRRSVTRPCAARRRVTAA